MPMERQPPRYRLARDRSDDTIGSCSSDDGVDCVLWIGLQLCPVHIVYLMSAAIPDKGRPAEQVHVDSKFTVHKTTFIGL